MTFRLYHTSSATGVDIEPEWNFSTPSEKVESRHRTLDGSEFVYKWGQVDAIKLDVAFVNSSFQAVVNSWWSSNAELLWAEVGQTAVSSVHIVNKKTPIDSFVKPYDTLFKGKLELETY